MPKCLGSGTARLFADDTNLTFTSCSLPVLQNKMSNDLNEIAAWLNVNKLTLNLLKTDFMLIGSRQRIAALDGNIELSLSNTDVRQVESTKCLGVNIDNNLTWEGHLQSVKQKVSSNLRILKKVKPFLNRFAFSGVKVWNVLPRYLKEERSLEKFKRGSLPALVK